jgi:hypothetical protein
MQHHMHPTSSNRSNPAAYRMANERAEILELTVGYHVRRESRLPQPASNSVQMYSDSLIAEYMEYEAQFPDISRPDMISSNTMVYLQMSAMSTLKNQAQVGEMTRQLAVFCRRKAHPKTMEI